MSQWQSSRCCLIRLILSVLPFAKAAKTATSQVPGDLLSFASPGVHHDMSLGYGWAL